MRRRGRGQCGEVIRRSAVNESETVMHIEVGAPPQTRVSLVSRPFLPGTEREALLQTKISFINVNFLY